MACTNSDQAVSPSIPLVSRQTVRAKQLRLLYRNALTGITVNVLNAIIVAAVLWNHAPRILIISWCAAHIVVAVGRFILTRIYRSAADKGSQRWEILFSLGAACAGAVWGAIGLFAPMYLSLPYQLFVAFVIGGMAIGALAMSGAFLPAYLAFLFPALLGLALGFLLHAETTYVVVMAGLVFVFTVALYLMGRNLNVTLVRSIRLSLERNELNAQLEQRVAERTAELDRMVGQLAGEVAERESAERGLRVMADALPVQLAFVDTDLRHQFSNASHAKNFGIPVEAVPGRDFPEVLGESLFAKVKPHVDAALAGDHERFEIQIPAVGEAPRFLDVQYIPSRGEDGAVDGFYSLCIDITERKASEQARERLVAIIDATPDFVGTADTQGNVMTINPAGRRMVGLSEGDDIAGTRIADHHSVEAMRMLEQHALPAAVGGGTWVGENIFLARDGHEVAVSQVLIAHKNAAGETESFSTVARDIGSLKRVQQALRDSERRFRGIFDSTFQFIGLLTPDGILLEANRTALDFGGLTEADVVGRPFWEARWWTLSTETQERLKEAIAQAAQGKLVRYEADVLGAASRVITIDFSLKPVADEDGNVALLIPEGRDITEQKQAEQALRKAKEQAERANVTKTRFLAAASHDLRQPLQSLQSYLGVLSHRVNQDNILTVIQKMGNSVLAMRELLDALLDVSRLDSGQVQPDVRDFPVAEIFDAVAGQISPLARENNLGLRIVASSCLIRSDRVLLQRIVENFVHNAMRYTDTGRILLGCRRRGENLRIEVWDTGIGIPNDALDTIFEEFTQLDNPARDRRKGLGLGLAIVQRLARILGHDLDVTSTPSRGSMFGVVVPLGQGQVQEIQSQVPPEPLIARGKSRGSILLIEDEPAVLESTRLLLEVDGFNVATATSGDEAVAQIKHKFIDPDVILSDYRLPQGETGDHVVRRIRNVVRRDIPAIIMTGDTEQLGEPDVNGLQMLFKPIESDKLIALIGEEIRDKSAQSG